MAAEAAAAWQVHVSTVDSASDGPGPWTAPVTL